MTKQQLVGVMGSGMVGTDPFDPSAWSGSSRYFFGECRRIGILHRAYGVEVARLRKIGHMLVNFSPDREVWRRKFYLDTDYYDDLSRCIVAGLKPEDEGHPILQIGGIFNLRPLLRGPRRLFSYHDGNLAQAMTSPQFARSVAQNVLQRALAYERAVYHNIDIIFTMSDYLRRSFIQDFGVPEHKVKTIGAGINLPAIPQPPAARDFDAKKLLFLGADFERKGGQFLLRAFKKVRSAHPTALLRIVGPSQLQIPAELSAGVEPLGFLDKKDPAGLATLEQVFNESTLFVLPSLYEPFGIAPLEAMAYEMPAVLTDSWAFPEMVTPGVNGALVKLGDADDLADKIVDLLNDPDRLQAMGRAGRQRVLAQYTWEAVVAKLRAHLV